MRGSSGGKMQRDPISQPVRAQNHDTASAFKLRARAAEITSLGIGPIANRKAP